MVGHPSSSSLPKGKIERQRPQSWVGIDLGVVLSGFIEHMMAKSEVKIWHEIKQNPCAFDRTREFQI